MEKSRHALRAGCFLLAFGSALTWPEDFDLQSNAPCPAQTFDVTYCLGDRFTLADVCLIPQVFNAERFNCDLAPCPTVMRVFEAGAALDALKKVEPSTQPDAF